MAQQKSLFGKFVDVDKMNSYHWLNMDNKILQKTILLKEKLIWNNTQIILGDNENILH